MALRIKDNVNLKQLEKFGFAYDKGYEWQGIGAYKLDHDYYIIEVVDDEDRFITLDLFEFGVSIGMPSVLFDLIEAGLVEKKED